MKPSMKAQVTEFLKKKHGVAVVSWDKFIKLEDGPNHYWITATLVKHEDDSFGTLMNGAFVLDFEIDDIREA